ncbi:nuclear transport factor 2 family protein [Actinoplanes sp. NPDC026619]|uniref:nuclear transport factor 2 family protein n=1 Tax=Actinoplanes sp. NPDC026619 TaxID=3155798 RepID=UPI0033C78566
MPGCPRRCADWRWRDRVATIVGRFPDVRLAVTAYARVDDLCFVSWNGTATAAGTPITWDGIDRMRLRNGLVVDSLVAFDTTGLRPAA